MIRMKFRDDGDIFETLLIDDRDDVGPELRQVDAPGCDAGPVHVVDVPMEHCNACVDSIAEQIGLSDDEVDRIVRWRDARDMTPDERKSQRMTPAELGEILDKIVSELPTCDGNCPKDVHRIMVEVEPTP